MKILLINVCLRDDVDKILFPVGLGYIASAISRTNHELEIIDMDAHRMSYAELEEKMRNIDYDAVGLGCIVTGYKIVKTISKIAKRVNPKAYVIAGNSVASSIPEILLKNTDVDIAVIGEGDHTIVELLDFLDQGKDIQDVKGIYYKTQDGIKATAGRNIVDNIDDIPLPNWTLFEMERYLDMSKEYVSEPYPMPQEQIRAFAVNTARGCAFNCTFCYHVFKEEKYRFRSTESIIEEIRELQERFGVNYINFWDELTFFSKKQTHDLIEGIEKSGLKFFWTASCRGNLFTNKDMDLLKRIKAAGCVGLGYSLESANKDILKKMNKKLDPMDFIKQKKVLDAAGIITWTSLVIGYPEETEETINQTFNLCFENDIYPSAGFLLPQPGTPIYQYALENKLITNEEEYFLDMGDRQDLRINMTKMPQDKLEECVNSNLKKIRDKLDLDLSDEQLLKSGKYRSKAKQ
ncbi:MAG: B12-binding domain-containing radical SAM protein [Desulfobacula sp.]|nr:B12-binding domain-containing radical SAM protein [Desulfobacula sp.]